MHARRGGTCGLLLAVLLLAACGAGDRPELVEPSRSATTGPSTTTTVPVEHTFVEVAEAIEPTVEVFAGPRDEVPARTLVAEDQISGKLVFLVERDAGERLEVRLPVRPNGSTGWIDERAVAVTRNPYRIEIALGGHTMEVYDDGEKVMDTEIAVGTDDAPSPGDDLYVKELLRPPDPDSVYGSYAYGLSGFSNALTSFAGGRGVVGIHGTDDPSRVGSDVSVGSIHMTNADIERLVEEIGLPLGTPVDISA